MRRSLSQSPGRIFYGWWIVAIGCVQDAVKGGLFNTGFTLYFLPVLTELNLSRAATSLPFSLSRLEAALGAPFVHESVIGTRFTGRLLEEVDVAGRRAVVPEITGRAWITGMGQYLLDPDDPFPEGFRVG